MEIASNEKITINQLVFNCLHYKWHDGQYPQILIWLYTSQDRFGQLWLIKPYPLVHQEHSSVLNLVKFSKNAHLLLCFKNM